MGRPVLATDEALTFLDNLREFGTTNMYGAAPYLAREFGMDKRDARDVLSYWMQTFSDRHSFRPRRLGDLD